MPRCGAEVRHPKLNLGCARWCSKAAECLGQADGANSIRERLISAMKAVFGADRARIKHALMVLSHAEKINEAEKADPLIVTAVAVLHDIGIQEAERRYGSASGRYQEIEGPDRTANRGSTQSTPAGLLRARLLDAGALHPYAPRSAPGDRGVCGGRRRGCAGGRQAGG